MDKDVDVPSQPAHAIMSAAQRQGDALPPLAGTDMNLKNRFGGGGGEQGGRVGDVGDDNKNTSTSRSTESDDDYGRRNGGKMTSPAASSRSAIAANAGLGTGPLGAAAGGGPTKELSAAAAAAAAAAVDSTSRSGSTARGAAASTTSDDGKIRPDRQQQQQQQHRRRDTSRSPRESRPRPSRSSRQAPPAPAAPAAVVRATRFLSNPSVASVPLDARVQYLKSRGLTEEEIGAAVARATGPGGGGDDDGSWAGDRGTIENGADGRDREVDRESESDDDEDDDDWDSSNDDDGDEFGMEWNDRRPSGPPSRRRRRDDGRKARKTGATTRSRRRYSKQERRPRHQPLDRHQVFPRPDSYLQDQQPLQQQPQQLEAPPGVAVPLTIGGMMGVAAIAALRWLNGGEFLLFPPPTNSASSSSAAAANDTDDGEQLQQQQQQQQQQNVRFTAGGSAGGDGKDNISSCGARLNTNDDSDDNDDANILDTTDNNEQDNTKESDDTKSSSIYDYLDEYLGEDDDEGEEEEFTAGAGDDDDGGAYDRDDDHRHNQDYHTSEFTYDEDRDGSANRSAAATTATKAGAATASSSPSSSDAVLANRLRDLTTAVEKFASVQERTLQVRTDEKGRAVTNSAMDLLRQSSTVVPGGDVEGKQQPQQQHQQQQLHVALAVLLTEMKCEMTNVREALADASGDQVNRAEQKLEAVTKMFERLEGMLIDTSGDGGGVSRRGRNKDLVYENDLPVATNVANMYETPSRMFTSGELSPVPGCKDGDVTALDVTLTLSPDRTTFDDDAEDDAHSSPAEEQQVVPIEPVGREALSRAIDILADPAKNSDDAAVKACAQMLYLYVVNLSSNASSKRYRRVYTTNANFKNKVGAVPGGLDVLESVGFVDKGAFMEWEGDINEAEEGAAIALLNEAAAQLSILKVVGRKRDVPTGDRAANPISSHAPSDITTPSHRSETLQPPSAPSRHRSETPPPFGAPPRPSVGVATSASGSASGSAGSYTSGSEAAIQSVASPSGFITPRMRGDGSDRFLASPADSIASSNLICSPPVIKQLPSGQDGMAEDLFGTTNRNHSHKREDEHGLGFPSAPQLTAAGTGKSSESGGGIFRTTKTILPPRGPSAGISSAKGDRGQFSRDMATEKDSVIGAQGSAFMRRAGSSVSDSAAATEGGGIKLKLRRSAASEDDAEFAPRRASDPNVDHVSEDTPFAVPVAKKKSDDEPAMYFNLSAMGAENGDGEPHSPSSNYSPSTLDYTQSPLNTSLISMRTDITDTDTPSRGSES